MKAGENAHQGEYPK